MEQLPPTNTMAVLLLCGTFDRVARSDLKPLTPAAYHRFARWLRHCELAPHEILDIHMYLSVIGHDCPVSLAQVSALLERRAALLEALARWDALSIQPISVFDELYPDSLTAFKHQAPPLLYMAGNRSLLGRGGLAIVGSRRADDEALEWTRGIAQRCAEQNIVVVSGGAEGVDSAAVQAALDAGGSAIVVLAERLAKAIRSQRYAQALADSRLLVVSPYDPDTGWNVGNAMARNKLIYALAGPGLVVSTDWQRGGTWAGALEALRRRTAPLFVRIEPSAPQGNHQLLALGALPFPAPPWHDLADIVREQHPRLVGEPSLNYTITTVYRSVLPLIRHHCRQPQSIASLTALLDAPRSRVAAWLDKATSAGEITRWKRRYVVVEPERIDLDLDNVPASAPAAALPAFDAILALLVDVLTTPHTLGALSAKIDEPMRQVRMWLDHAVAGGHVMQRGVQYVRCPWTERPAWNAP